MIFNYSEIDRATLYLKKLFERGRKAKIEAVTQSKTLSQNSYSWLVFTHIGNETGNTKEDIYQFCLKSFPTTKEIDLNGIVELIPVTLSGMTKEQTSHFIDQFTIFFGSEGYSIPDPEDIKTLEMYNYYKEKGML
jgi:hypothetical protein